MRNVVFYLAIFPVGLASLMGTIWIALRGTIPTSLFKRIALVGFVASLLRLMHMALWESLGFDHSIFFKVGQNVWNGIDPYHPAIWPEHPFLNPPSTLAYFALIAAIPFQLSLLVWTLVDAILIFALVFVANEVFTHGSEDQKSGLTQSELAVIATALTLSFAAYNNFALGQLSIRVAAFLLFALLAQAKNKPILAGICLGLATMKIGTMVPFLLLFLRKKDWKTWISLGVTVLALIVIAGQPSRILDQSRSMLREIALLAQPGGVNDITFSGPFHESIIGIDHLGYRIGIQDPTLRGRLQMVVILLLGAGLAYGLVKQRIGRDLGIALVSLYSVIFLYHRIYDAVVIAPALVYAVMRSKQSSGAPRNWYLVSVVMMLAILSMRRNWLLNLNDYAKNHHTVLGSFVQGILLPSTTWLILLSMGCLSVAALVERRQLAFASRQEIMQKSAA